MTATDIQLWSVPDCPLAGQVRDRLRRCLLRTATQATVHELHGDYPSPTLLINGIDVATGTAPSLDVCCRLDLPTETQILTALAACAAGTGETTSKGSDDQRQHHGRRR